MYWYGYDRKFTPCESYMATTHKSLESGLFYERKELAAMGTGI